jgi:hypothetical protein
MKGSKSLIAISIAVSLVLIPSAIAAPKTTVKAAGPLVTKVVNTILNGVGVPSKKLGINGDFYIDTKSLVLYGPKINGAWKNSTSLKQAEVKSVTTVIGEAGAIGDKGATGNTGATGSVGLTGAAGIKGLDGAKGSTGLTGATGSTGLTGATGLAGAAGIKGDAGTAGAAGAAGVAGASGAAGVKGDTGLTGSAGATGSKGDTGLTGSAGADGVAGGQGAKGDPGAPGVSVSYFLDLGTWTLNLSERFATSDSSAFVNLEAGSYTFEIIADGTFSPATTLAMTIGMQVITSAGVLDFSVFASDAITYLNFEGTRHYQFMIIGKIVCTGAVSLKLRAVNQNELVNSNLLNFTGRALINKVGSIG